MPYSRCATVLLLLSSPASSALVRQAPHLAALASQDAPSHPWVNRDATAAHTQLHNVSGASEVTSDIYFLRHGETVCNTDLLNCFIYRDGQINEKGIRQAVAARRILVDQLRLHEVPDCKLQLAAAPLSRTMDTLIIGSRQIWESRLGSPCFLFQELPALMEHDPPMSQYSSRKGDLKDDDPARWQDSTLSQSPGISDVTAHFAKQFFREAEEVAAKTTKPVEVQARFERIRPGGIMPQCSHPQDERLKQYLLEAAASGRRHIVLGTSGMLTLCAAEWLTDDDVVPCDTGLWNLKDALPNGAVLHIRLRVVNGAAAFESQRVYLNTVT